jgi:hypothetical protein
MGKLTEMVRNDQFTVWKAEEMNMNRKTTEYNNFKW